MSEIDAAASSQSDRELWRDLCEKDDRTSPWASMALINQEEFIGYLVAVRTKEREAIADWVEQWGDNNTAACIAAAIRGMKP